MRVYHKGAYMPEQQQEITRERWIAWAQRVFKRGDVEVEFLDEKSAERHGGNVQITVSSESSDADYFDFMTVYFDFNSPPIF